MGKFKELVIDCETALENYVNSIDIGMCDGETLRQIKTVFEGPTDLSAEQLYFELKGSCETRQLH